MTSKAKVFNWDKEFGTLHLSTLKLKKKITASKASEDQKEASLEVIQSVLDSITEHPSLADATDELPDRPDKVRNQLACRLPGLMQAVMQAARIEAYYKQTKEEYFGQDALTPAHVVEAFRENSTLSETEQYETGIDRMWSGVEVASLEAWASERLHCILECSNSFGSNRKRPWSLSKLAILLKS
jgi:hypothetical protein